MARETAWYTLVSGTGSASSFTSELLDEPGTILRMIGGLNAAHDTSGVGPTASFHWIINVGSAAADPNTFGLDDESTMLHGAGLIPNTSSAPLSTTPPSVTFDTEGSRIIEPGDSLWLRMDGGSPAGSWGFTYSIRVLLLLPES